MLEGTAIIGFIENHELSMGSPEFGIKGTKMRFGVIT